MSDKFCDLQVMTQLYQKLYPQNLMRIPVYVSYRSFGKSGFSACAE